MILSSTETLAKGDAGNYEIVNNTAGQKTEETTDDSVTALVLFIVGVLLLSLILFCVIRWFLKLDGRESTSSQHTTHRIIKNKKDDEDKVDNKVFGEED